MTIEWLSEEIKGTIPEELVPAVEALAKTLDDAHFKCGRVTEVFCYVLLHPGEELPQPEEHGLALMQLKVIAGPAATEAFNHRIRMGTAPAYYHAMQQLYIAGMIAQAIQMFNDLLAIGKANAEQLGESYIRWAHDLTLKLVQSYESRVKFWIRAVCDPPDRDLNWNDPDEIIMGKTWCAPMLLVMQPSRYMKFDAARQWERVDRQTSKDWLESFAEMFTIHIKIPIDRLAGEKTVELAKQPKPAPQHNTEVTHIAGPAQTNPVRGAHANLNIRQEYRKRETDKRNRKIRSEFKKLERRIPNRSSVWYSEKLAASEIARGLNPETIRKIIRV